MRGGYRQGAGRKKGFAAKNAEEARKYFSERVAQEIEPLCDRLLSSAKAGDIRAIQVLFDLSWGRPAQAIQLQSEKLPVPIMVQFLDDAPLEKYAFTDDERGVLEKRLIPRNSKPVAK